MANLAQIKAYCRIDDDAEDVTLAAISLAAVAYLNGAGVTRSAADEQQQALYDLAHCGIVLHWFDHRDDMGVEMPLPAALRPVLQQLKLMARIGGTYGPAPTPGTAPEPEPEP